MDTLDEGFQMVVTIVEKGKSGDVVDAARACGAEGGTIIPARGTGVHEHQTFFGIVIEPEKEIIMILVKNSIVDNVLDGISKAVDIEKPGNGIAFTFNVPKVIGINHLRQRQKVEADK